MSTNSYNISQGMTVPQSNFSLQYNETNQKERSREQACVRYRTSIYFGFCILSKSLPILSTKMNVVNMPVHLFSLCLCWILVSTQWLTTCTCRNNSYSWP